MSQSCSYAYTTVDPSISGIGARSLGMGRAFTGVSDDITSMFINPAGLENIKYWQVTATSLTLLTEIQQNSFGTAFKTNYGTFGLGFVDVNMAGSPGTTRDTSNLGRIIVNPSIEAMGYDNNVVLLSYAKRFDYFGELLLGTNIKFFNQSISGTTETAARGTANNIDIGLLYTSRNLPWASFGFTYSNLLAQSVKWSQASNASDSIGGAAKFGFSGRMFGETGLLKDRGGDLVLAADITLPRNSMAENSSMLLNLGAEWKPVKTLFLRCGYDRGDLTYGIGLEKDGFRFDYGYKSSSIAEGTSHVFSLTYAFFPEKRRLTPAQRLVILEPADKGTTALESIVIKGRVENAGVLNKLFINTKLMPALITGETFETSWEPVAMGENLLTFEAQTSSFESQALKAAVHLLRVAGIKDIKDNYFAKDAINYLTTMNLMSGYPDGSFKPEKAITRAELVALLVRAKGIKPEFISAYSFKDLPSTHWAAASASISVKDNLMTGYPDMTFKPNKKVTRAEAAAVLVRFGEIVPKETFASMPYYSDVPSTHWAFNHIEAAQQAGMFQFIETKYFEANKDIPRGEVAFMLVRTKPVSDKINKLWGITAPTAEATSKEAAAAPVKPVSKESFEITSPADTPSTYADAVLVSGKITDPDVSEIMIGADRIILLPGEASFSKLMPLVKGENLIEVKAISQSKTVITTKTLKITRN